MSVMIIDNAELNTLAAYVAEILNGNSRPGPVEGVKKIEITSSVKNAFADCRVAESGEYGAYDVYLALENLNVSAYNERYCDDVRCAGHIAEIESVDTREATRREWQVRLYNLLRFFIYQCEEPINRDNAKLKALISIKASIAETMASDAVNGMGLKWGRF